MKNVFHFILKALFVLKIFKFLPRLFLTKKEKQLIKLRLCVLIMSYTRFRVTLHSEWQVIWILSYCNGIRTHNHLVRKGTLNLVRKRTRNLWRRGAVVISTAQLHSTKLELRFCVCSNPGCSVWEIRDGEDLRQWSQLEIRLNAFRRSTIPQKYFSYFSPNFISIFNGWTVLWVLICGWIWLWSKHFSSFLKGFQLPEIVWDPRVGLLL